MKKLTIKIVAILLVLSLVFIVGCNGGGGDDTTGSGSRFVGGSEGLEISFFPGSPPPEILDDAQGVFSIGVNVKNAGEHVVERGDIRVSVSGFDPEKFNIRSSALRDETIEDDELLNVRKTYQGDPLEGGEATIWFSDLSYLEDATGDFTRPIRAEVCYEYKTDALIDLCVKKADLNEKNPLCVVSGTKNSYNSGAPIHVTGVGEKGAESKIHFTFKVEHVGVGSVFSTEDDECEDSQSNVERNKVWVELGQINGKFPECQGLEGSTGNKHKGYVRIGGVGDVTSPRIISCSLDVADVDKGFVDSLPIELKYNYLSYIQTEIAIKDVPK